MLHLEPLANNVVSLNGTLVAGQVNDELVSELEYLLEEARAGYFQELCYSSYSGQLGRCRTWHTGQSSAQLLGSLRLLDHKLTNSLARWMDGDVNQL
jgi:hypothetical protein